jgi:hypothetical protein
MTDTPESNTPENPKVEKEAKPASTPTDASGKLPTGAERKAMITRNVQQSVDQMNAAMKANPNFQVKY